MIQSPNALLLPLGLAAALAGLSWLPSVTHNTHLWAAFLGTAASLAVWTGFLFARSRGLRRALTVNMVLRPQHYVQACAQGTLLLYWGWYWREVYDSAHLILAQLLFAYAFDILLTWSRRDSYALGFSPFPVVFSINLFLWFKADWFVLQFVLIAVGFAVKELVRWKKDDRRVHIFNPSSLPLGLFSLGLIVTGTSDMTWGQQISTTLNLAPHIYLVIFLVSLPGQWLFGVTTMTMSAVVTMYSFGLLYFAATGTYYFVDAYIPIAVFLGMHLLFTDPSTSPRTELGRIIFGMLYALSVITLYAALDVFGAPRFYDKLLAVPVMNLAIQAIDRLSRTDAMRRFDPAAWVSGVVARQRNLAYIGVWTTVFIGLSVAQAVGDSHRGRWVPFWQHACADDRPNGCRHLGFLISTFCTSGSGWACNEYGILLQPQLRPELAADAFKRSCDLGFSAGCTNLGEGGGDSPVQMPPTTSDYRIVLQEGKGFLADLSPLQLYQRACTQGFTDGCRKACDLGEQRACAAVDPLPRVGWRSDHRQPPGAE